MKTALIAILILVAIATIQAKGLKEFEEVKYTEINTDAVVLFCVLQNFQVWTLSWISYSLFIFASMDSGEITGPVFGSSFIARTRY